MKGVERTRELQTNAAIEVISGILDRLPDEAARQDVLSRVLDKRCSLPLDDYEAVNLLWLLRIACRIDLDTGDWLGQLTRKLEMRGHGEQEPNASSSDTELRLLEAARRIMGVSNGTI